MPPTQPLAEKLRPTSLKDVIGQDHLLSINGPLGHMIESKNLTSHILWGPPGCGKTTLARLMAASLDYEFFTVSAIFTGVADLRRLFEEATLKGKQGKRVLLFVDEIHRFNKAQQDSFLPYVEQGIFTLIGATTENPSFELNSALLSRCQVFVLKSLTEDSLEKLLKRAEISLQKELPLTPEARQTLLTLADGDGRYLLNLAETLLTLPSSPLLTPQELLKLTQKRAPLYDKGEENHYNLISALHKSLRSSDTDAALYWFARMLEGGEDPLYILRRLIRFASEDIGLADPNALSYTLDAYHSFNHLGSPEGELAIVQCLIYLSTAPKSNSVYTAYKKAKALAQKTGSLPPPPHSVNAPTNLMKELGYGKGYAYDHDLPESCSGLNYFPEKLKRQTLYLPKEVGFEREVKKRLNYWQKFRGSSAD